MKNILIYLPALFLLFGCEDFLNRAAYDQMDSENFSERRRNQRRRDGLLQWHSRNIEQ